MHLSYTYIIQINILLYVLIVYTYIIQINMLLYALIVYIYHTNYYVIVCTYRIYWIYLIILYEQNPLRKKG